MENEMMLRESAKVIYEKRSIRPILKPLLGLKKQSAALNVAHCLPPKPKFMLVAG